MRKKYGPTEENGHRRVKIDTLYAILRTVNTQHISRQDSIILIR